MSYVEPLVAGSAKGFARCDPRVKLAWLVFVSLATVLVDSTPALLVIVGLSLAVACGMGWTTRTWGWVVGLILATAWGTVLSQAMFYGGEPRTKILTLFPSVTVGNHTFAGLALYREGATYGLLQSARIVAVILAGLTVCLSTSSERLLAALTWLRVPAAISFMTVAALRLLPTFFEQWSTARRSYRLRGYRPRLWQIGQGIWNSWRTEAALLVPVVAAALRRAGTLATALTARGFDAAQPRTSYPEMSMARSERAVVAALVLLGLALAAVKSLYWLSIAGVVHFAEHATWQDFARNWL